MSKAGSMNKSKINAMVIVMASKLPICEVGWKGESPITRKPATRMILVITIATPTVEKEYCTASRGDNFKRSRAYRYLDMKCTVSSTMIPMAIQTTADVARPI